MLGSVAALPRGILRTYAEAYSGLSRDLWLLALTLLINRAGSMVLAFMTLYLTQHLNLTATQAGQVMGVYGGGSMVSAWLGGWLSDRMDPHRVQRITLVASGLGFIYFPHVDGFWALCVAAGLLALLADSFRPAVMVAAVRIATPEQRPRALALMRLAMSLGMSIGPALGGFLAARAYDWLFYVDGGTCLAAAVVHMICLGSLPSGRDADAASSGPASRPPWEDRPYLAFLAMTVGVAIVIFQLLSTWPLYLRDAYFLSETAIGAMFAANAFLIAVFEMLVVRRLERRNFLRVAGWGGLVVALGMAILPIRPPLLSLAILSLLVWTAGEMLFLPITLAVVGKRAGPGSSGRYMGAYAFCYSLALVIAPVIGTYIYDSYGGAVLWYGVGATGPLIWLGYRRLSRLFEESPATTTPEGVATSV